jgi:hypothetical protein
MEPHQTGVFTVDERGRIHDGFLDTDETVILGQLPGKLVSRMKWRFCRIA